MKGLITNIQRFSLDDGPGIRTTVFFKGCSLACIWCHNPETICPNPEIQYNIRVCRHCDICNKVCPEHAISNYGEGKRIDKAKCTRCGTCVKACLYNALTLIGSKYTVERLLEELLKDKLFYEKTGGGVTLSGGEPLLQDQFVNELLAALKENGISVALDTCGNVKWEAIEPVLPRIDLFLYDIKTFTPGLHKEFTGRENNRILENLKKIDAAGARIWIRIPMIEGLNDVEVHMISEFLATLQNIELVELLPYHELGLMKYESLGLEYCRDKFKTPSLEKLKAIGEVMVASGLNVNIKANGSLVELRCSSRGQT